MVQLKTGGSRLQNSQEPRNAAGAKHYSVQDGDLEKRHQAMRSLDEYIPNDHRNRM